MPGNRRPSWLRLICTPNNLAHLKPRKCDGCSQWTITCETDVWESWDPGIITGQDILTAIILNQPLTRIQWIPGLNQPRLINESMSRSLDPTGLYLAPHRCRHTPISHTPFKPPKPTHRTPDTWKTSHEPTPEEINAFEHVWNTPSKELEKIAI